MSIQEHDVSRKNLSTVDIDDEELQFQEWEAFYNDYHCAILASLWLLNTYYSLYASHIPSEEFEVRTVSKSGSTRYRRVRAYFRRDIVQVAKVIYQKYIESEPRTDVETLLYGALATLYRAEDLSMGDHMYYLHPSLYKGLNREANRLSREQIDTTDNVIQLLLQELRHWNLFIYEGMPDSAYQADTHYVMIDHTTSRVREQVRFIPKKQD